MVITEIDDDVDTTDIYMDNESDEVNMAQLSGESESVDEQEYYSDGETDEEDSVGRYVPPTPPSQGRRLEHFA